MLRDGTESVELNAQKGNIRVGMNSEKSKSKSHEKDFYGRGFSNVKSDFYAYT